LEKKGEFEGQVWEGIVKIKKIPHEQAGKKKWRQGTKEERKQRGGLPQPCFTPRVAQSAFGESHLRMKIGIKRSQTKKDGPRENPDWKMPKCSRRPALNDSIINSP